MIFLFKWDAPDKSSGGSSASPTSGSRSSSSHTREPLSESDLPPELFFAHQVTTNACATQAILSVVLNRVSADHLGPILNEFKTFTSDFPPNLRGMAVSGSEEIRAAHNSFSRHDDFLNEGKVYRRDKDDDAEAFHFVAYVPFHNCVYELDGLQSGPIVIGSCDDDDTASTSDATTATTDWLAVARDAIHARMAEGQHVKYNLMAVVQDKRVKLQERLTLDPDGDDADEILSRLAAEQSKRDAWKLENQRRRHNYVPLCVQLLKELAKQGSLERLAQEARVRAEAKRSGKVGGSK